MPIVTFWNDERDQTGKTLTAVAVATRMAIERNYKILLISTSFQDPTIKNCFWGDETQKTLKLFGIKSNNIAVENGIEGLIKLIAANKLTPNVITDYTKVIFKERLEIINGFLGAKEVTRETNLKEYEKIQKYYIDLIKVANQYYDMVLVDLDKLIPENLRDEILNISNLNVYVLSQKKSSLDRYLIQRQKNANIGNPKTLPVIGKYIANTKYNSRNVMKYMQERKELNVVPFNILYFEAAEDATVPDLFLRLRSIKDTSDENYIFMQDVIELMEKIIKKLQELQMKMR